MKAPKEVLTQIKAVYEHCCNNGLSKNFGFPSTRLGVFKTPTMILCLDNRRRRVWCSASNNQYFLFVNVQGKRLVLAENQHQYSKFECLEQLIVE